MIVAADALHGPGWPAERRRIGGVGCQREREAGRCGEVHALADDAALGVVECLLAFVRDRQVRRPGHREATSLGAEDHVLEAVPSAGRDVTEMAGVVPP